jgi:hypothetical protein
MISNTVTRSGIAQFFMMLANLFFMGISALATLATDMNPFKIIGYFTDHDIIGNFLSTFLLGDSTHIGFGYFLLIIGVVAGIIAGNKTKSGTKMLTNTITTAILGISIFYSVGQAQFTTKNEDGTVDFAILSPGWLMDIPANGINQIFSKAMTDTEGLFKKTENDTANTLSCSKYIDNLYDKASKDGVSSARISVSHLWEIVGVESWKKAQFGDSKIGDDVYCHLLEIRNKVSIKEQLSILKITGHDNLGYSGMLAPSISIENKGKGAETAIAMLAWGICSSDGISGNEVKWKLSENINPNSQLYLDNEAWFNGKWDRSEPESKTIGCNEMLFGNTADGKVDWDKTARGFYMAGEQSKINDGIKDPALNDFVKSTYGINSGSQNALGAIFGMIAALLCLIVIGGLCVLCIIATVVVMSYAIPFVLVCLKSLYSVGQGRFTPIKEQGKTFLMSIFIANCFVIVLAVFVKMIEIINEIFAQALTKGSLPCIFAQAVSPILVLLICKRLMNKLGLNLRDVAGFGAIRGLVNKGQRQMSWRAMNRRFDKAKRKFGGRGNEDLSVPTNNSARTNGHNGGDKNGVKQALMGSLGSDTKDSKHDDINTAKDVETTPEIDTRGYTERMKDAVVDKTDSVKSAVQRKADYFKNTPKSKIMQDAANRIQNNPKSIMKGALVGASIATGGIAGGLLIAGASKFASSKVNEYRKMRMAGLTGAGAVAKIAKRTMHPIRAFKDDTKESRLRRSQAKIAIENDIASHGGLNKMSTRQKKSALANAQAQNISKFGTQARLRRSIGRDEGRGLMNTVTGVKSATEGVRIHEENVENINSKLRRDIKDIKHAPDKTERVRSLSESAKDQIRQSKQDLHYDQNLQKLEKFGKREKMNEKEQVAARQTEIDSNKNRGAFVSKKDAKQRIEYIEETNNNKEGR